MPIEAGEVAFANSMSNLRDARELKERVGTLEIRQKAILRLFTPLQIVEYHRYLYYNETPEINDKEYDALKKSLDSYY